MATWFWGSRFHVAQIFFATDSNIFSSLTYSDSDAGKGGGGVGGAAELRLDGVRLRGVAASTQVRTRLEMK